MKLNDSRTVFFIPFRVPDEKSYTPSDNSIWKNVKLKVETQGIYPYIQNFLIGNLGLNNDAIDSQKCIVYSLKSINEMSGDNELIFNDIKKYDFEINYNTSKDNKVGRTTKFRFIMEENSVSTPLLILYPFASVGMLTFICEPPRSTVYTIDELTDFNYNIHKIDKSQCVLITKANKKIDFSKVSDEERKEKIEESQNENLKKEQRFNEILNMYNPIEANKTEEKGWYLLSFIHYLLSDMNMDKDVFLFNENRVHLFNYLQINAEFLSPELLKDFVRIIRSENSKYKITNEDVSKDDIFLKSYENVFIGSGAEGAAIMTIVSENTTNHILDFKTNSFMARYLWVYLLVLIQRYTLLEITRKLVDISWDSAQNTEDYLNKLFSKLSYIKQKANFTDISDHTHINDIYRFWSNNLSILKHLSSIKEKLFDLKAVVQKQIEKEDKKRAEKLQETLEANEIAEEKRDKKLQMFVAFLTTAQIFFAFVIFSGAEIGFDSIRSLYLEYKFFFNTALSFVALLFIASSFYLLVWLAKLLLKLNKDK